MNKILITGGLGYIGSHTVAEIVDINSKIIIVDNINQSINQILT